MPVLFVLKRFLPEFTEFGDLYQAIKTGKKTSEWRDGSDHWIRRLLTERGRQQLQWAHEIKERSKPFFLMDFSEYHWKHKQATFVVGYTKYPRLLADIKAILYNSKINQFEIRLKNVREIQQ